MWSMSQSSTVLVGWPSASYRLGTRPPHGASIQAPKADKLRLQPASGESQIQTPKSRITSFDASPSDFEQIKVLSAGKQKVSPAVAHQIDRSDDSFRAGDQSGYLRVRLRASPNSVYACGPGPNWSASPGHFACLSFCCYAHRQPQRRVVQYTLST